ncbi:MAG: HU family DNA-binding protein [Deltaproteobacteria bacterium]|nr:HU family DNA-binding protein [Deltaproteobacteria bacterium]
MTKAQLIEHMAKNVGISKAEAGKALNSLIDSIGEAVKATSLRRDTFHSSII